MGLFCINSLDMFFNFILNYLSNTNVIFYKLNFFPLILCLNNNYTVNRNYFKKFLIKANQSSKPITYFLLPVQKIFFLIQ